MWSPHGRAVFHTGHKGGAQNYAVAFLDRGAAIVLLSNSDKFESVAPEVVAAGVGDSDSPFDWLADMKRVVFGAWRFLAGLSLPSKSKNADRLRERGETVAYFAIREATAADIPALAQLHVMTWNATYAPLLMHGPSYEVRERQWREAFTKHDRGWFCFVVERPDGELVGFAKGNKSDHPEFAGELNKIYLLREYQRVGLGRRLLGHVVRRFLSQGINSMWLLGDARNPSSRVWTALGAVKTDDDPGNGNYGWRDLRKLAALCEARHDSSNH